MERETKTQRVHNLAVYGTLLAGCRDHDILERANAVKIASGWADGYIWHTNFDYPIFVKPREGLDVDGRVYVEVYSVDDEGLAEIERSELLNGVMKREGVKVRLGTDVEAIDAEIHTPVRFIAWSSVYIKQLETCPYGCCADWRSWYKTAWKKRGRA